ncbi:condensin complex subunit 1 isoform X2 [Patella vulgata]|uniref:condensin complex subunit 1 isoform X2 n=1 Tax=Patella vulgata TaxID=6465 RepID=UPI0024A7EA99|nr:condensin complex subunit 1 isoform X2 [Patella vulgata]
MTFEFFIPMNHDGLLTKTNVNQYVVEEVLPLRLIPGAVQDFKFAVRSDHFAILAHFDTAFSVLCLQRDVDSSIKDEVWDLLIRVGQSVTNQVSNALEDPDLTHDDRLQNLNALKMTCYMICQFIDMFEAEDTKPVIQLNVGKGRGKQRKATISKSGRDWEMEKRRGIQTLLNLLQRNLNRLWDPPVAEEEFINLVSNCCYRLLENPGIAKTKETRDVISNLLGVLVKKYNHGLGASLKIMQLLQHFEHLVVPLVQTLEIFVNQYQDKTIVSEMMREIGRMDTRDVVKDSSGTRVLAQFLVELAQQLPAVMLPSISVLVCHLDGESYTLRNGVLGVMGEMLIKVLSQEDLEDKLKPTRESFLDKLEDHIHDVNAFVRSRVLQIWLNIVNEKCLPLPRQENLVNLILGRLQDKSSSVRKYAIQLMIALMKNNPFASKLPVEELQASYEKEKEKLKDMTPEEPDINTIMIELEACWTAVEKKIRAELKDKENDDESDETNAEDEISLDQMLENIYKELVEERYSSCYDMIKTANTKWPDEVVFQYLGESEETEKDGEEGEEDEKMNEEKDENKTVLDGIINCLKDIYLVQKRAAVSTSDPASQQNTSLVNEVAKQQVLVQYLKDSTTFANQIQQGVPIICQLLGSKTTSDVFEAIEFFVTGFEFGVAATMMGIRRMLVLIWSSEQTIKDAVVGAYKRLYLNPQAGGNQRTVALAIVKNLTALLYGASLGDITSFEALIQQFVNGDDIGQNVVQILWEKFIPKIPNTSIEDSRAALLLLSMIGGAKPEIIKSNIDVLVSEGLGKRAETDLLLAQITCRTLLKLAASKKTKGEVAAEPYKFSENHEMFTRLSYLLVNAVTNTETRVWVPFGEQAINVIYKLSEQPDTISGEIIKKLAQEVGKACQIGQSPGESHIGSQEKSASLSNVTLTRLLSISGHVALRQLVHLDNSVFGEMKRRRAIQEDKKEKEQNKTKPRSSSVASTMSKIKEEDTGEGIEDELGLAGAAAEDAEAEYIRKICETDVVTGENLLSALHQLIVVVCTNSTKYPDTELRTAATLALAKFTMVSSEFCDAHLQLLFTILEKSPNPAIRANTIIALGDLSFRFPNLIEPWTPHLYGRLRDQSPQVRKNTLQVLTHLILNDMVKVKGQISELGTCIIDHDERIANLAKLFWLELSKKGNAVYNVMPDVISRLSDPDIGVDEDCFRTIMKYLFGFVQKDKHCESLVEKICHRYRATRVDRQWRDLSYCLSLLSYNEKSLRKLQENLQCFADKLVDDEVYSCFCSIINKSRSFVKPEAKMMIDELEEKFEKCHKKGLEDEEISQKASSASDAATKHKNKHRTPGRGTTTPGRRRGGKENKDDIDSPIDGRKTRTKGRKPKPKVSFSSDEESDVELFDVDNKGSGDENIDEIFSPKPSSTRKTRNGRTSLGTRNSSRSMATE